MDATVLIHDPLSTCIHSSPPKSAVRKL